jgi:hypothetical protein
MQPISIAGNVSVDRITHEINKLVYSFDYVTTLYDFYGFKKKTANETKTTLQNRILTGINPNLRNKVIPYVQMYEFEGLLFTSPAAIGMTMHSNDLRDWAQTVLKQFDGDPEAINDSPQTAPLQTFRKTHALQKNNSWAKYC